MVENHWISMSCKPGVERRHEHTDLHHLLLLSATTRCQHALQHYGHCNTPNSALKHPGGGLTWGAAFLPPAEEENIMDYLGCRRAMA